MILEQETPEPRDYLEDWYDVEPPFDPELDT